MTEMSYREYINKHGNLVRRHHNGHRFTNDALAESTFESFFDDAPDCRYWELASNREIEALEKVIGPEACSEYEAAVWPGETLQERTWKEIAMQNRAASIQAIIGSDLETIIMAAKAVVCKHDWMDVSSGGYYWDGYGPADNVQESTICIHCGITKTEEKS